MRAYDNGAFFSVSVSPRELQAFAERWPCSGMRGATRGMWFQYDKQNGDLVDIKGERKSYDEGAVKALSEDAQAWGQAQFRCTNCGGPLPEGHGAHFKTRRGVNRFCDECAGIAEALRIGAGLPVMLYESTAKSGPIPGLGAATAWTGVVLGYIYGKTVPTGRQMRGAVRFRVRMLDGSKWVGTGPTDHGNYMRLRRAARQ